MLRGVAGNRYSRNEKFIKEVTAETLRNKCSGKGFDVLWITFYKLFEVLIS